MINISKKNQMSKFGFFISSLGSALGLGVIWGLPGYINNNGGFYFFIMYVIALFIIGIPLLIFEFNLGNLRRKSIINIFNKENINFSFFLGWFQSSLMFIIPVYYSILVSYTFISLIIQFFPNLINFKKNNIFNYIVLEKKSLGVTDYYGFQWFVFLSFLLVIFFVGIILFFGIKGIEKINKIFIPLLFFIILFLSIFIIFIPGSKEGILTLFLKENFKELFKFEVLNKIFSLAFFTTSIGMGMMIVLAGSAPENQDNSIKAYLLVIGIIILSIFNLIFIFGSSGVIVKYNNIKEKNIFIFKKEIINNFGNNSMLFIFNILPIAFNIINNYTFTGFGNFIGILFFLSLFIAGLSTIIGNLEVIIISIKKQYNISLKKIIFFLCIFIIFFGLILVFENTYKLIESFQLISAGLDLIILSLIQIIFFIHKSKKINEIINFNNKFSLIKINKFYIFIIYYIIPFILINVIFFSIYDFIFNFAIKNYWYISFFSIFIGIILPLIIIYLNKFLLLINNNKNKKSKRLL